ncbi:MAG: type ISP restriction/modification enzyme, partial [Syntrophales bacterium]
PQPPLPAPRSRRQALEEPRALRIDGEKGEHFVRSTLIQTLFYGVFSAWVLWARRRDAKLSEKTGFADTLRETAAPYAVSGVFDWRSAHYLLRVPMLRALFVQVADPARLGALGLIEVLDWTAATLNRVDHAEFFQSFDEGHAVQYFYEPFLHAFDPDLRKELGVWYTPEEIVRYQVERVDAVLRSELGLADGLADPNVVVLDPCCGTGAYLRAVLRRIAVTLHDKGGDALVANDLKKAAMERVFGFEILPAPFVIAHLQLGLELETLGAPLSDRSDPPERAGVYLTNALTGWEPPKEKPKQIAFPGFDDERDAAGRVKQEKPILVIIGNPPYNAFAGVSPEEEDGLVEPYKKGLISEWGIKKFNLDELYSRFLRLAERRVAEKGGRGVVCYISSFSYVSDPSFVVLRKRFLDGFDSIWIDCLNGDSRETGKQTPDGKPDPSVFSTEWNRAGIRVGTAIGLFVKRSRARENETAVHFRHFWGATKRADLLTSLDAQDFDVQYETSNPRKDNRWSFRPSDVTSAYLGWPRLTDLCMEAPSNGLMEKRGGALMDDDRVVLETRMKRYLDKDTSFDDLKGGGHPLTHDAARYDATKARAKIMAAEEYDSGRLRRYALRPYDQKWCYFTPVRPIWNEPRPSLWLQCWEGNRFLMTRPAGVANPEGVPFFFTGMLGDNDFLRGHAYYFPLRLKAGSAHRTCGKESSNHALPGMEHDAEKITANLSSSACAYLVSFGLPDPDADQSTA